MTAMPPADLASRRWLVLLSAEVSFFAVGATFFVVPPLVPALRAALALTNLQLGLLMGAIAVPAIVLSLPLGAVVDRWPPRAAGVSGLALMAVGAVVFAVAPVYGWLMLGRVLFGIGGLVLNLSLARLIAQAFAGRELALAMGLFMAVYPASMIAMFSLHPWLVARLGWRGELLVLALLVVVALPVHLAATHGLAVEGAAAARSRRWSVPLPLAALGATWMLFFAAFSAAITFAPEWAGARGGLLVVATIPWVMLVAAPLSGAAIDRLGRPALWCGAGMALLAAVLAAMAGDTFTPVPAMALVGLAGALVQPATYALPPRLVPAERVGFAFGFITALSNLGTVVGPAAAGALRDEHAGWPIVWLLFSAAAAVGALTTALIRPRRQSAAN
jgi:MFS family permease